MRRFTATTGKATIGSSIFRPILDRRRLSPVVDITLSQTPIGFDIDDIARCAFANSDITEFDSQQKLDTKKWVTSIASGLQLEQLGWNEADHHMCVVTIPNAGRFLLGNIWMQGLEKIVNDKRSVTGGHQKPETKEMYRERICSQARWFAYFLNDNPDIIAVFLQESVLEAEDKKIFSQCFWESLNPNSPFKNFSMKTTSFGVSTLLREDALGEAFHYDERLSTMLVSSNLWSRCQAYKASDAISIINMHNLYGKKGLESLEEIIFQLLMLKSREMECDIAYTYLFGDFNLSPKDRKTAAHRAFLRMKRECVNDESPLMVAFSGVSSPDGHKQTHHNQSQLVNTDGCMTLKIEKGPEYRFTLSGGNAEEMVFESVVINYAFEGMDEPYTTPSCFKM